MSGPCDDIRVLDLSSGPAGGIATMMLADYGADVIKIERPGGDPLRRLTASPVWLRGKRSLKLDLREQRDRERLGELARGADVNVRTKLRQGLRKRSDPWRQHDDTPLHLAIAAGQDGMAKLLQKHGADRKARNSAGRTPFDPPKKKPGLP